jgi:DNA/RNA endonuclease YhcR with UshA esterase domain
MNLIKNNYMHRNTKIILSIGGSVIGLVLIALIVGLFTFFKPHKDFAVSKADFILTAQQLFDDFNTNEQAAIQKYVTEDKTVQITGIVQEISKEQDGTTTLLISQNNGEAPIITCNLINNDNSEILKIGSTITLKGQCTGIQGLLDISVYMIRCAVVKE